MKQLLLTIVLVLALSMNVEAIAQKHRHTPRTEQVDSTKAKDAIEAFSDTTTVADDSDSITSHRHIEYSEDDAKEIVREVFSNIDSKAVMGMLTAVWSFSSIATARNGSSWLRWPCRTVSRFLSSC